MNHRSAYFLFIFSPFTAELQWPLIQKITNYSLDGQTWDLLFIHLCSLSLPLSYNTPSLQKKTFFIFGQTGKQTQDIFVFSSILIHFTIELQWHLIKKITF
jgi:hypothetical protein